MLQIDIKNTKTKIQKENKFLVVFFCKMKLLNLFLQTETKHLAVHVYTNRDEGLFSFILSILTQQKGINF